MSIANGILNGESEGVSQPAKASAANPETKVIKRSLHLNTVPIPYAEHNITAVENKLLKIDVLREVFTSSYSISAAYRPIHSAAAVLLSLKLLIRAVQDFF